MGLPSDDCRIIVAMDYAEVSDAKACAKRLDPKLCRLKVGNELFTSGGPDIVKGFQDQGFEVFLDLKYHDIPNTVASAVAAAARLGVWMVNVHAGGGVSMLKAARAALDEFSVRPLLIAVTVLTSLSDDDLREIGWPQTANTLVPALASTAWSCGFDGFVCSAQEAELLKTSLTADEHSRSSVRSPVLVTPGIRPQGSPTNDQARIMTPAQAILAGSTYLVIGRPITQSTDPQRILRNITEEIASV
jgi:orotidine-5'-phosphate decarboxylase